MSEVSWFRMSGLRHNPATMEKTAGMLKHLCGASGTVKEEKIEIQGDQHARVTEKLTSLNYTVR